MDYHRVLLDEAIRLGAVLQLGAEVEDIYTEQPAVLLADGRCMSADVVIGADGNLVNLLPFMCLTVLADKQRSNVYGPRGCSWISSFSGANRRHGLSGNIFPRATGGFG